MPKIRRAPWIARDHKRDNYYIFWFDDAAGRVKRRSCSTRDRGEAEKELGRFLIERAYETKNTTPIMTPDKYPVTTALRWYAQERGNEIASSQFMASSVENLIKFFGPNCAVANLTPQVVKRYATERTRKIRTYKDKHGNIQKYRNDKPVSTSTIKRELSVLAAALSHAVKNGRLTSAPKLPMPPEAPSKTRYLERDEISRLLDNCIEPHIKLFTLLALNTGARKGALLDLQWQQIDFAKRIIYLNPEGRLQTAKRRAIVPINDAVYEALTEAREKIKKDREKAEREGNVIQLCPYVVTYRNNPVLNVKTGFMQACRRAGITGVTPHTLRHTAGTLMALAGIDLFLIAKVLGHSIQKTTELYAHFHPEYLRNAVNALNSATPKVKLYEASDTGNNAAKGSVSPAHSPAKVKQALPKHLQVFEIIGAGEGDRTLDPDLGNVERRPHSDS